MKRSHRWVVGWIVVLFACVVACGESENTDPQNGDQDAIDVQQIFSPDLVREVLEVPESIDIQQTGQPPLIGYAWDGISPDPENIQLSYSVGLRFDKLTKQDAAVIDSTWTKQNEGIYGEKELETVENVGRKATWSDHGGGQLRVATDDYLFYLNVLSYRVPTANPGKSTQDWSHDTTVENAAKLARAIIDQL